MKKQKYYFILPLIQITFCSKSQTVNDDQIAFQKTQIMIKSYDVLFTNRHKTVNDSLIITPNNYQSYRTAYIISESIGVGLIGLYARSSLNKGISTNIGLLYSGIGASISWLYFKLKSQ